MPKIKSPYLKTSSNEEMMQVLKKLYDKGYCWAGYEGSYEKNVKYIVDWFNFHDEEDRKKDYQYLKYYCTNGVCFSRKANIGTMYILMNSPEQYISYCKKFGI